MTKRIFKDRFPSGMITTSGTLDRENLEEYELVVEAVDKSSLHRRSAQVLVKILVEDVNDQAPLMTSPAVIYVQSGAPVGSVVGKVTATDSDLHDRVTFELIENTGEENEKNNRSHTEGFAVPYCGLLLMTPMSRYVNHLCFYLQVPYH